MMAGRAVSRSASLNAGVEREASTATAAAAAAAAATTPGLVDLEKELTCSVRYDYPLPRQFADNDCLLLPQICADILYQPLTLLDCLHTFCGACLAGWFAAIAGIPPRAHSETGLSSSESVCQALPPRSYRPPSQHAVVDLFV